jgi:hypothetical protein
LPTRSGVPGFVSARRLLKDLPGHGLAFFRSDTRLRE